MLEHNVELPEALKLYGQPEFDATLIGTDSAGW